ncbi:hypothetical protein JKP88DRAFT_349989 [Tribonema minus]|uniref:Cyclin N-terminal domain-containing protein n=1 Tax=Tribonema minus TaxID=303371 RepID=A0A836CCQ0_9STRA|nr:hypothetical protein JKP88DRAFT_349989 [Tribonema minus]
MSHTPPSFYTPAANLDVKKRRFTSPMLQATYLASPQVSMQGCAFGSAEADSDRERRLNNSTSTIFASSTLSNPDADQIILCMSAVLKAQMEHDCTIPLDSQSAFGLFEMPGQGDAQGGLVRGDSGGDNIDDIYAFVHRIYSMAQFSPECCIISLVYINRIISTAQLPLHSANWRPLVLASLILAQKVWDDKSLATSTFAKIIPAYSKGQIFAFERRFLELLQYQAVVTQSLYARYYFELRDLFDHLMQQRSVEGTAISSTDTAGQPVAFPLQPLSLWRAKQLELYSDSFHLQTRPSRSGSSGEEGHRSHMSTPCASPPLTPAQTLEDITYTPRGRYVHS